MSFGDLSAFGGDFSKTPEKLEKLLKEIQDSLSTRQPDPRFLATRRQWANVCTWLKDRGLKPQALSIKDKPADEAASPTLKNCVRELLSFEKKQPNETALHQPVEEKKVSATTV